MSRPYDWSPLDRDSDPTPGDTVGIETLSKRYADTAQAIADQAQKLRSVSNNADANWKGKAGDAFRKRAGDLSDHIEKARSRYVATATALHNFGVAIAEPQAHADAALTKAIVAQQDLASSTPLPSPPAGSPAPTPAETTAATRRSASHADAAGRLQAAKATATQAATDYAAAAKTARDAIHDAVQHDGVHDSWWDRNAGWIKSALKWIGVAILVLAVVAVIIVSCGTAAPAFLVAAAAWMEIAATGLTVVSLIGHTALALNHQGSWTDVAFDFVGLCSFGLARYGLEGAPLLSKTLPSLKSAAANAEPLARTVAGARAGRAIFSSAGLPGLAFRLAGHPGWTSLLDHVLPGLAKTMPEAERAAAAARAGVTLTDTAPWPLRVLMEGDTEMATNLQKLRELNTAVPGIVRNQLRAAAAFTAAGTRLTGDLSATAYAAHDAYEKFIGEPNEDAKLDAELEALLAHYQVAAGHVR